MIKLRPKKRRREIWGVVCICLLAFIIVSLLSYDPRDPSLNSVSTTKEVHNLVGLAGSYMSDILFQTFGISSYLFLFPIAFLIMLMFFPSDIPKRWSRLFGFLLLIIFTAGFASITLKSVIINDQKLLAGGFIGHTMTALLLPYFNTFGSYIIILGGIFANIILAFNLSVATVISVIGSTIIKTLSLFSIFKNLPNPFKRRATEGITLEEIEEPTITEEPMIMEDEVPEVSFDDEPQIDDVPEISDIPEITEDYSEDAPPPEPEYETSENDYIDEEPEDLPDLPPEGDLEPDTVIVPPKPPAPPRKKKFLKFSVDFLKPKGTYRLPKIDLIADAGDPRIPVDRDILIQNSRTLEQKLRDFSVDGRVVEVRPGPVITVYEFEPAAGIKVSKIVNLSDDLALALSAESVRIVAPIPGKSVVGIELPNRTRNIVYLKEILRSPDFSNSKFRLPVALGKTISGDPFVTDLVRMPHLLVAGATGSGKSVFLNSLICSFLFRYTPDQLRFLMIDPKMLELSMYDDIPHLLLPVVTDPKKAAQALKWAVQEMERRYHLMSKLYVRNVDSYNRKIEEASPDELDMLLKDESDDSDTRPSEQLQKLPLIVIVIDELADLMMVASKEVELSIARLAQMARASGIHLIVATQRPSVDVLTGLIKANFPARIAFQTSSRIDSRTILDYIGAEKLLGNGDMLFSPPGISKVKRVHGAYVTDHEVKKLVEFLKKQGEPVYDLSIITKPLDTDEADQFDEDDDLYQEAVQLVSKCRYASISMIQRRLRIGYNRAARMIEQMETEGIVGPSDGAKPREVLIKQGG